MTDAERSKTRLSRGSHGAEASSKRVHLLLHLLPIDVRVLSRLPLLLPCLTCDVCTNGLIRPPSRTRTCTSIRTYTDTCTLPHLALACCHPNTVAARALLEPLVTSNKTWLSTSILPAPPRASRSLAPVSASGILAVEIVQEHLHGGYGTGIPLILFAAILAFVVRIPLATPPAPPAPAPRAPPAPACAARSRTCQRRGTASCSSGAGLLAVLRDGDKGLEPRTGLAVSRDWNDGILSAQPATHFVSRRFPQRAPLGGECVLHLRAAVGEALVLSARNGMLTGQRPGVHTPHLRQRLALQIL